MWPAPVSENDILWLDAEADPPDAARGPATGLAVSHLLTAGVSIEWHDAVAIVAQLADEAVRDNGKTRPPVGALPSLNAIWLEPDGRVHATLDRLSREPIVAGFGRVLQALLHDRPAAANLRLLGWRATSEAGAKLTLDDLIVELARWERPGRVAKLVNLYERARAAGRAPAVSPPAPIDIDIYAPIDVPAPALETRVAEPPPPRPQPPRIVTRLSERQIAIAVVGVIACLVAAGSAAWWLAQWGDAPATHTVATSAAASGIALPASSAVHEVPHSPVEPAAARTAPRLPSEHGPVQNSSRVEQSRVTREAARDTPAVVTPSPMPTPTRIPLNAPPADVHAPPDTRLYRSDDETVTEPVLVKPRLPLQPRPEIPESALGVLELVVDESGHVESVHLRSPANRYREKWWLFAAKDWQFEPARKQGRPVRFLKRIPLTDLNIAEPQ